MVQRQPHAREGPALPVAIAHIAKRRIKARPERRQLRRLQEMIDLHSGNPWESVVLTSLFSNQRLFTKLLNEARELAQQQVRPLGSA